MSSDSPLAEAWYHIDMCFHGIAAEDLSICLGGTSVPEE